MNPEPMTALLGIAGATWPLALTMAVAVAGGRARERRRRRALNERLHELRRPLQSLALAAKPAPAGPDALALALAALGDLDREVNGERLELRRRPIEARMLAIAAAERWRVRVAAAGRRIGVRWHCGEVLADVDPVRVAQTLDNLIANALEHGGGTITIEGSRRSGRLELTVRDRGAGNPERLRVHRDPRRGHGLRLSRSLVARNGGCLRVRAQRRGGTAAAIVLPLVRPDRRRARAPGSSHRR